MKPQNEEQKSILTLKENFFEVEAAINNLIKQKLLPEKYHKLVNNIKKSIPGLETSESPAKDNAPVTKVLFRVASDGNIIYLSASSDDLLGFKPEEMIGKSIFNFISKSEKSQYFLIMKKLLREKTIFQFKTKLLHNNGREVLVDIKASIQKEKGERFVLGSINEIPDQTESKEKSNTNEVIFKAVWQNSQHGIRLTDSRGTIYLCNQAFARLVSKKVDELIGQPISFVYSSDQSEKIMNDYKLNMASENVKIRLESSMKLWNGDIVETEVTNTLVKDAGKHKYLLSIFRDITQKRKDDELIKRKDQLLQGIAETSKLLISLKDDNKEFYDALEILGRAVEVDRVSIFQHLVDEQTQEMYFSLIHEWASDKVEKLIESPYYKKISYSRFTGLQFYENFSSGKPLRFIIDKLPKFNRDEFMDKQIKSTMLVPIMIEDAYWGFIGFDDLKINRTWTEDEESILVIIASTLGAVIKRNLFKEDLFKKNIELKESANRAEELSKVKSEFLSLMSHEIRTPLNGVLGMIDLLLETKLEYDQKEYAKTIKLSGEQLLSVVNNVLDFSKIESGKLEIEKGHFVLRECIEDSFDLLTLKASEKELELIYSVEKGTPLILVGDVMRLRQVLTNLISNGIKFTDKGVVQISVKAKEIESEFYELQFCVKDTGIGIPEDKIDRLFKHFSQVDSVDSRSYGGSGLGLVVAKKLVEMMNGKMWVESVFGKGTSFFFNIIVGKSETDSNNDDELVNCFKDKKVLFFSKNKELSNVTEKQLNDWSIKTSNCMDEKEFLKIINSNDSQNLIIYDINGFTEEISDMLISIKQLTDNSNVPVIFLIPFGKSIEELNIFGNNAIKLINKPLKFSYLHFLLREVFSNISNIEEEKSPEITQTETDEEKEISKILLIEPSKEYQAIASQILLGTGHSVNAVASLKEAQEAINIEPYFMALIDSTLAEEGLILFNESLKEKNGGLRIVIMVDEPVGNDEKLNEFGYSVEYINKPLRFNEVEALFVEADAEMDDEKLQVKEYNSEDTSSYINEEIISSLFDLNKDEDYQHYLTLLDVYLKDLPELATKIDEAIKTTDFQKLRFYSHKLGGSIQNLGVEKVVNICLKLEEAAKNKTIDESVIYLNFEFQKVMNKIISEISEIRYKQKNFK